MDEKWGITPEIHMSMATIARQLRRTSTSSETILWESLRNRRLNGLKFRRQQPVGLFVLDFYCSASKLAVEVDGKIHEFQKEADAERQYLLESIGIRFLRVTASEVENDLLTVLAKIEFACTTPST